MLRVGGLGNRQFGRDADIDEAPKTLQENARVTCETVLREIQRIVDAIHAEEVGGTQNEPRKFPPIQNRLRFWCESQLCLLSGKPDIFSRRVQEDRPAPVFRSDSPLIKIISGEEPGGDSIIRDAASGLSSSLAEFKLISVIVQESGKETSADTFVVGTIPPRDLDQSKQQPPFSRQLRQLTPRQFHQRLDCPRTEIKRRPRRLEQFRQRLRSSQRQ